MSDVCKGWGVHLETVEITDVRIMSGTLFSNMQTKFREQNRKTAEIQTMTVNYEIEEEQLKHSTDTTKRDADTKKTRRLRDLAQEIEQKKRENEEYGRKLKLDKQAYERQQQNTLFNEQQRAEQTKQSYQISIQQNKADIGKQVQTLMNSRSYADNQHKISKQTRAAAIEVQEIQAANERAKIQQDFDLKKEKVADAAQLQMLKLQTVKDIHAQGTFYNVYFNTSDEKEPIYGLIDKFIDMTKSQ
jgi:flotillin